MEQLSLEQIRAVTDAMTQPAFAAQNGTVCYENSAFAAMQIAVGTPLSDFFGTKQMVPVTERTELSCTVAGVPCQATAVPLLKCVLYILQLQDRNISVHALSHTSKNIRTCLHEMYSAAAGLCAYVEEAENEKYQSMSAGMLQQIYRLEHTAQNLEFLQALTCGSYTLKPEKTELVNYLSGLFAHADDLLKYAGIRLHTELPDKLFNGSLDHALAEAVIWNALSNAAKHTVDQAVFVRAAHRGNLLQITFVNQGELSVRTQSQLFTRYQVPMDTAFSDPGSGFGLSVIRQAVSLHGGTMLFAAKPGESVAFTVTFDLSLTPAAEVRSPMPVQTGLDQGLVRLAEVLPRAAYDSRAIF